MLRVKSLLVLLLAPLLPACGYASNYCIATNGGFGHGGTTFIEPNFTIPSAGKCESWTGFTKTAGTVVLFTYGTACLSSGGKGLTVAVSSSDPDWFGFSNTLGDNIGSDYIQFLRTDTSKPFTSGDDLEGAFGGDAEVVTCTSSLLTLPSNHA